MNSKIFNLWEEQTEKRQKHTRLGELLRHHTLVTLIPEDQNKIIDIGCGLGYLDYLIARQGKDITGVDISLESLNLFKDIAEEYNIKQIHANLFDINVNEYDLVICQEVLEHIEDYESAIMKMNNFIKHNGFGLFCVPYNENLGAKTIYQPETKEYCHKSGHVHSFDYPKLADSMGKCGFKVLRKKLIANKRVRKIMLNLGLPINRSTLLLDSVYNYLFPHKASWLAVLGQKK